MTISSMAIVLLKPRQRPVYHFSNFYKSMKKIEHTYLFGDEKRLISKKGFLDKIRNTWSPQPFYKEQQKSTSNKHGWSTKV